MQTYVNRCISYDSEWCCPRSDTLQRARAISAALTSCRGILEPRPSKDSSRMSDIDGFFGFLGLDRRPVFRGTSTCAPQLNQSSSWPANFYKVVETHWNPNAPIMYKLALCWLIRNNRPVLRSCSRIANVLVKGGGSWFFHIPHFHFSHFSTFSGLLSTFPHFHFSTDFHIIKLLSRCKFQVIWSGLRSRALDVSKKPDRC